MQLRLEVVCYDPTLLGSRHAHPTWRLSGLSQAPLCSVLSQRRPISFNAMSNNPPPELKSLFESALNEFEKRAGTNLVQHPIIDKLKNCESADSVIDALQEQAQVFRNFRGDDGKLMMWTKRTVNVVYTLSTSGVLGGAIGLVCVQRSLNPTLAYTGSA